MNTSKWQVALIIAFVIVSAGLTGSCTSTASTQVDASPPTPSAGDISTTSQQTADTTNSPDAPAATPSDETVIGNDPVSGRNEQIDLRWQELCLSSEYQVQIAKDADFTIVVIDTGAFAPASAKSPGAYYPAGGLTSSPSGLALWSNLESGHTYYWRARVRQAATGQYMRSPWSEVSSFTIGAGFPVSTPSYGLQPLYPNNGGNNNPVTQVSFTWLPLNDTTKYKFVLAKDAAMTQVVKEAEVTTTVYEYDGQLEYGQTYFWRVMALEPAQSDWSAIFSFRTEAAPPPVAEPVSKPTPLWVWPVISIGTMLIIAVIILIFKARRK